MMTASTLIVATSALVGLMLAENKALATLPFELMWLMTTLTSVPAALWMRRVGRQAGLMTGALLQLCCVLVNLHGQAQWNFVAALMLLGVGWNFLFLGGTTLLMTSYSGAEKATA
jgi:hypothetical protein